MQGSESRIVNMEVLEKNVDTDSPGSHGYIKQFVHHFWREATEVHAEY